MLDVSQLKTGIVLLASLAIAATPINALSPTHLESLTSQRLTQNLQAQDSQVPDSVKQQYREDAAQLALTWLRQGKSPASNEVELPAGLVETFYKMLIQVYQATDLPDRNLVVDTYNIHAFPRYRTRELRISVDPTQPWTQAWRNGKRLTGNAEIDALMQRFDLNVKRYASGSNSVELQTGRHLNTPALAKLFTNIKGVQSARADGVEGGGNDIRAKFKDSYWQLDYSVGFGDCMMGCEGRTTWTFHVYPNGKVKFAGRSGDAPPPPPPRKVSVSGIEGRSTKSRMPGILQRNPDGTQPRIEPVITPCSIPIVVLDRAGRKVTRIQPDKEGHFRITLKPGTYTLTSEIQKSNYLVWGNKNELQNVRVTEGRFTTANITYTELIP
jgi:hypothetical protein